MSRLSNGRTHRTSAHLLADPSSHGKTANQGGGRRKQPRLQWKQFHSRAHSAALETAHPVRHPRVWKSPSPDLAGSRASHKPRGKGASPARKLGIHGRGRGARRRRSQRWGAEHPDAGEGGAQRPVDRRCHCPDRPLGLGRARMLCAGRAAASGGVAVCPCAVTTSVGVGARRSRAGGTGRLRCREVELRGEHREPPLALPADGGLALPRPGPARARRPG